MSHPREAKLRKLNDFRRQLPHVTASALAAILGEVAAHGVPESHSRQDLSSSTAAVMQEATPYGPLLIDVDVVGKDGSATKMLAINPLAMTYKAFAQGGSFTDLMLAKMRDAPPTPELPWQLILYADEVVPGNALSHDNRRKVWVVYFSWMQLGPLVLQEEEAWLCCLAKRSSDVAQLASGISQAMAALLRLCFGDLTSNLATGGMLLKHSDGSYHRLFCKLGMVLQDGGAHKLVWQCKGDAGTRLCMLCRNLVSLKSDIVDEHGASLLSCSIWLEDEMDFATDQDIRGTVARLQLAQATTSKAQFEQLKQACGFNLAPHGILLDTRLMDIVMPASQFCHDWMHCIFVHGVFHTVMHLLFSALLSTGSPELYDTLFQYFSLWKHPLRQTASKVQDLFSTKRAASNHKAKAFKCTASEGLCIYPILSFFLQSVIVPAGVCAAEVKAFLSLCDVVDLLQATPLGIVSSSLLREAVRTFLDACLQADWKPHMHSKFHWLVHLSRHLENFKMLPTCWVHERKHRVVKRYANDICNTVAFEKSILSEVACHNLAWLARPGVFNLEAGLIEPRPVSAKLLRFLCESFGPLAPEDCSSSPAARIAPAGTCTKGDIVICKSHSSAKFDCGELLLHCQVGGRNMSLISMWQLLRYDPGRACAEWAVQHKPSWVTLEDVLSPVTYTRCRPDAVRTLLPVQHRA